MFPLLKREKILISLWGNDDYFSGRSLDVYISRLRKFIKNDPKVLELNIDDLDILFKKDRYISEKMELKDDISELDEDDMDFALSALRGASGGSPVLAMSGGTGEGTAEVLRKLVSQIQIVRSGEPEERSWQP